MGRQSRDKARNRLTVEKLAADCLDVGEVHRAGILSDHWTVLQPLMWPGIVEIRACRALIELQLSNQLVRQQIRVSWTPCHFGAARPWLHCSYCGRRVARLLKGLGGFFCRACVGNPLYESQRRSTKARAYLRAFRLRQRLGGSRPVLDSLPTRPYRMKRAAYWRLCERIERLERSLVRSRIARRPSMWNAPLLY